MGTPLLGQERFGETFSGPEESLGEESLVEALLAMAGSLPGEGPLPFLLSVETLSEEAMALVPRLEGRGVLPEPEEDHSLAMSKEAEQDETGSMLFWLEFNLRALPCAGQRCAASENQGGYLTQEGGVPCLGGHCF